MSETVQPGGLFVVILVSAVLTLYACKRVNGLDSWRDGLTMFGGFVLLYVFAFSPYIVTWLVSLF